MSSIKPHDWEYELDLAGAYTQYRCWDCQVTKYEHRNGTVTYSIPSADFTSLTEASEMPCCSPPFVILITEEEFARAGYVKKPPDELAHVATVRRIAARIRDVGYGALAQRVLEEEGTLAVKLASPWADDA